MSSEDSKKMIDKVTSLSGDLHHSVMMAKQFLIEVMIIALYRLILMSLLIKGQWLFIYTYIYKLKLIFCLNLCEECFLKMEWE